MSETKTGRRLRVGKPKRESHESGHLKIGDDWNAIRIIALSQSNPLKAVAEFVENSIDARAKRVTITRFRQHRQAYIRIVDDGDGVPLDDNHRPNFRYVATHICDSIKRRIRSQGQTGIQGEFGIGLLSFWTVGETLSMICPGGDGKSYEMRMAKGQPGFTVTTRRTLAHPEGTELTIGPLLPGIRNMSGEKLQWYLASELRDRIRHTGVDIRIIDRLARAEFAVIPREYDGQLLHHLPAPYVPWGDVYVELYLAEHQPDRVPSLHRAGTRVLNRVTELDVFQKKPWTSGYFAGVIDAPFLNLTPGTRLGVIHDERLQGLVESLAELEQRLNAIVDEQQRMAGERANRDTIKAIQKAFREALLILPEDEYDWFDIYDLEKANSARRHGRKTLPTSPTAGVTIPDGSPEPTGSRAIAGTDAGNLPEFESSEEGAKQKSFFEHPGPLYSARISPTTCTMSVGSSRTFQAVGRDQSRRWVTDDLSYEWQIVEGAGQLESADRAIVMLTAPSEPQLLKLSLTITQHAGRPAIVRDPWITRNAGQEDLGAGDASPSCRAEAIVTVTDTLLPQTSDLRPSRGLPEYTFEKQPGQLWRSRLDTEMNLVVINSGHRDFAYAAQNKALKLRYICRLFAKELVLQNFPGLSPEQLLERMIELGLYTEENLR